MEGMRAGRGVPDRASPPTCRCSRSSAPRGAVVFSDALNHASIIDGCRMARAGVTDLPPRRPRRPRHALLAAASGRPIIVSDTVFSMDGDAADLDGLVELAARHGALLVLDEAHAVLGPRAARAASGPTGPAARRRPAGGHPVEDPGLPGRIRGRPGPVRRTAGQPGPALHLHHRPHARPTPPPPWPRWASCGHRRGEALRARLATARGPGGRPPCGHAAHPSPIVPVIIGDEADAVAASGALLERGLWVPAIRPPTVPPGTSRLRITLSAIHTDDQVDRLVDALDVLGLGPGPHRRIRERPLRPERMVLVCGTGTEVGKTWVAAGILSASLRPAGCRWRPASRPSPSTSTRRASASEDRPTPSCWRRPRASTPMPSATRSAPTTGPWPRPWRPRRWASRPSPWPTSSRSWAGRPTGRCGRGGAGRRGAVPPGLRR